VAEEERDPQTPEGSVPEAEERNAHVGDAAESQAAEESVCPAEHEWERARSCCGAIRRKASDQVKRLRQKSVGEVVDGTLEFVRRHPGPGVIAAVLSGFFLGRLFRR